MLELPAEEAVQRLGLKVRERIPQITTKFLNIVSERGETFDPGEFHSEWYRWIKEIFYDEYGQSSFVVADDCFAWSGHVEADGYCQLLEFLFKHDILPYIVFIDLRKYELSLYASRMGQEGEDSLTTNYTIDLKRV